MTVVATLSIALGIGANTAIFSLIDSLILRKLPVKDPVTLMGAVGVLVAIGLVAGLLPALKAARIDPAALLRES